MNHAMIAVDDRDFTAESAHRLCELQPDIPAPQDDQVPRYHIEFQGLDVGQRL